MAAVAGHLDVIVPLAIWYEARGDSGVPVHPAGRRGVRSSHRRRAHFTIVAPLNPVLQFTLEVQNRTVRFRF